MSPQPNPAASPAPVRIRVLKRRREKITEIIADIDDVVSTTNDEDTLAHLAMEVMDYSTEFANLAASVRAAYASRARRRQ